MTTTAEGITADPLPPLLRGSPVDVQRGLMVNRMNQTQAAIWHFGLLARTPRVLWPALAALSLLGCGQPDDPSTAISNAPWSVDPVPILDIGSANGPESHQLFGVRGARLLEDGTLAIGNAGSGEVRFYSASGALLRRVGARGEGPGEFEHLLRFWITPGDTTIVFDAGDRSLVTFDAHGALVSDRALEKLEGLETPGVLWRFSEGTLVVRDAESARYTGAGKLSQDTAVSALYDADGRFLHRIRERPGRLLCAYETPGQVHFSPLHFGANPSEAVGDSVIYMHDGVSPAIEVVTRTGGLQGRLDLGVEAVPPLEEEVDAYRRHLMEDAQTPEDRKAEQIRLDVVPFAQLKPTLNGILVTPAGDVWARRFRTDSEGSSTWAVFRDGWLLGDVEVPDGVTVLSIAGPHLVGLWRDNLRVEHVRVYALTRPSATVPG